MKKFSPQRGQRRSSARNNPTVKIAARTTKPIKAKTMVTNRKSNKRREFVQNMSAKPMAKARTQRSVPRWRDRNLLSQTCSSVVTVATESTTTVALRNARAIFFVLLETTADPADLYV